METFIFIFIVLGVFALVYLYGLFTKDEGYQIGYKEGSRVGQITGATNLITLFEDLELIDLEEVAKNIKSGKYDHVNNIGKIRKLYFPD